MRVIAGKARRLLLKTVDSMDTRPTTDRIKETLFNILQNDIEDSIFLDLFAGSGGIGIEALSRDARKAVFVDSSKDAIKCIRENLEHTGLMEYAEVMECDALTALRRLEKKERFDIVYMDPPYNNDIEKNALKYLATSTLIDDDCLIIIEADKHTNFDYTEDMGYNLIKEKVYKTNKHIFLERKE